MARSNQSGAIAFGGVLGALAVVIMCMGTLIPVATFACPVFCMLILRMVLRRCGARISWAWYGAVAILSLLMSPDKEAAAVFSALGFYPIIKSKLDSLPWNWLWKMILFNGDILILYYLLINLLGMDEIRIELAESGAIMMVATLILGNVTFFLLDRLLGMNLRFRR